MEKTKLNLPSQWVTELTAEDAPDPIWVIAGNMYADIVANGHDVPESFLKMLSCGEITDEDRAWVDLKLASMGHK